MLINALDPEESRIAVVEDGVLQELHVELANREAYLGNIYKGRVVNIEPSIGAAFVSFGGRVNGFLHVSDVLPAYGRPDFQLTDVVEGKARLLGDEGPESVQAALADDDADEEAGPAETGPTRSDGDSEGNGNGADEGPSTSRAEVGEGERSDDAADLPPENLGMEGAGDDEQDHDDDDDDRREEHAGDTGPSEPEDGGDPGDDGREAMPAAMAADSTALAAEPEEGAGEVTAVRPRRGRHERRPSQSERRRSRPTIDQLLKKGQEVVVQITKEGIGQKGPTLTSYVSLPGRYLVLMPSLPKCGVSRKIDDARERRRLKRVVRELDETGQGGIGFIVRTAGIEKNKVDLERDRDYLKKIWELVSQRLRMTRAPALLYQESDLVLKAMRDLFVPDILEVVVDNRDVYLRIKDFAEKLMPHMADRIKLHESVAPLFHAFGIEKEVEALYQPKFDLPSGASIVIDQTEALVAIDVNSGKYKPGADLEETAYRTNLDAIPDIVRQLRLRDLGGLIIIDFIDMSAEKHRRAIERRLIEALRGDRARIKVGRISPFGMLEITRQRVGPGLKRTVFMQCQNCKGTGWTRTVQSKALSVLREARALLALKGYSVLQVFVAPPVNDYLVNYKRRSVLDLEEAAGKTLVFRGEPSYPTDMVHYRFVTGDGQEARIAIPAGLGVKP
jgi:ribonuclease E